MSSPDWAEVERILEGALTLPEGDRTGFIERESDGDPALRAELLSLLLASRGAEAFLDSIREQVLGSTVETRTPVGVGPQPAHVGSDRGVVDPWVGRTIAHYRIIGALGGGGMGVVYEAEDLELRRRVAIKLIAPEIGRDAVSRERFLREARTAAALDHLNVYTIHEIAETDGGRLFIVMALYEGETLRRRLTRGRLGKAEAFDIARQLLTGLAAAHARGIVHRDVKPANVFLTDEGVVKLLDFGLARTDDTTVTQPGALKGTIAYMSPEQARGESADVRTDVWAAAVLFCEMLTGRRLFAAEHPQAAIHAILEREPDLAAELDDIAPELVEVVQTALAKDPARRYPDAEAFLKAFPGPVDSVDAAGVTTGGRGWLAGVAAMSLLTLLGLAGWRLLGSGERPVAVGSGPSVVSGILWVDDNPENNASVVLRARDLGIEVETALTTDEGLARYDPSAFQLVVSDMGRYEGVADSYVGRAGFNLLAALQDTHGDVPLVFCTSPRAVATLRDEALAAGAIDIFTTCDDVLDLVR